MDEFPRFGTTLSQSSPPVPDNPVLSIRGVVDEPFELPLTALSSLPRQELTADFHCVAGWSSTDLHWGGVSFATLFHSVIEPRVPAPTVITHVTFRGLDGFRSILLLADALADDVLIADHLEGSPLNGDHGAPARLVSPQQYGYLSTKHLCRIDVHAGRPNDPRTSGLNGLVWWLLGLHPRARVWEEERHPDLPAWLVRPVYRSLIAPIRRRGARARPARPRRPQHTGQAKDR